MGKLSIVAFLLTLSSLMAGTASAEEFVVDQQNKSFVEGGVEIKAIKIKVGDTIRFKNEDPFFHNIFSLSELATFDLGSYPKGQSKTVVFDKPGKIDVECAIHSQMHLTVTVK